MEARLLQRTNSKPGHSGNSHKRWTYAKAGLDVGRMRATQASMMALLKQTWKNREGRPWRPFGELGHYAATIDLGNGTALAMHADNVGTKVLIAQLMEKYNTIGIDCVAYNVNDLICLGAEPAAFLDYLVFEQQPSEDLLNEIMSGLVVGAEQGVVAIVGGETAVYPGIIAGGVPGKGFDFSGSCIGFVQKDSIITGSKIRPGDIVIGIESSGIHASGFTLARKVLLDEGKLSLKEKAGHLQRTLGEELLTPTKIYVKGTLELLRKLEIHALAHITGGSYGKLSRFFPYFRGGFHLESFPNPPAIFTLIQEIGEIAESEMYSTFNMGIGMCIVLPESELKEVASILRRHGSKTFELGKVVEKREILLEVPSGDKFRL